MVKQADSRHIVDREDRAKGTAGYVNGRQRQLQTAHAVNPGASVGPRRRTATADSDQARRLNAATAHNR